MIEQSGSIAEWLSEAHEQGEGAHRHPPNLILVFAWRGQAGWLLALVLLMVMMGKMSEHQFGCSRYHHSWQLIRMNRLPPWDQVPQQFAEQFEMLQARNETRVSSSTRVRVQWVCPFAMRAQSASQHITIPAHMRTHIGQCIYTCCQLLGFASNCELPSKTLAQNCRASGKTKRLTELKCNKLQ